MKMYKEKKLIVRRYSFCSLYKLQTLLCKVLRWYYCSILEHVSASKPFLSKVVGERSYTLVSCKKNSGKSTAVLQQIYHDKCVS